jgi:hypothetical protein
METALLALAAGALGAGITGLLQLQRDRIESLRQRQLDAADEFAVLASSVLLRVKLLIDSRPKENTPENVETWKGLVRDVRRELLSDVREVAAHAPRVELLFGVASPAGKAAVQAAFDLTEMARRCSRP